jgi:GDP-L-fucose synthase
MEKSAKIYLAGHTGLLGSAIIQKLKKQGFLRVVTRTHKSLDLTRQSDVEKFFKKEKPDYVILCAARVGGIQANISYPAEFIYENLTIQTNVIHFCYKFGVRKALFLGSACIYPRECSQPIKEENIFCGYLEPTNEAYAVAKISGITMQQAYRRQYCVNFICAIPTTIYGPNDNFDPEHSHVISALMRRFHEAKVKSMPSVTVWGSGAPVRGFIYVDDAADACLFLIKKYNNSKIINIGTGEGISIATLAYLLKDTVGFKGKIIFDKSKPDGMARKVLDVSRLKNLGWQAKISLKKGLQLTYKWYLRNKD